MMKAVKCSTLKTWRTVQSNVGEQYEAEFFMHRLNRYLRIIKATVSRGTLACFGEVCSMRMKVLSLDARLFLCCRVYMGFYHSTSQWKL